MHTLVFTCRIRKKARHQELLDNEQKYQELQKIQDLRKKRSECVHCFLSVRESMLRSSLDSLEPENRPPPSQGTNNQAQPSNNDTTPEKQGVVSPQRVVKFLLSNQSFLSAGDADAAAKSLDDIVDSGFEFTCVGGTLYSTTPNVAKVSPRRIHCYPCHVKQTIFILKRRRLTLPFHARTRQGNETVQSSMAMSAMSNFEKSLATRVKETLGDSRVGKLSYNVDDEKGIAINDHGTSFAEVIVSTRDRNRSVKLMTCILKLHFVPDSAKLQSIVWHITQEYFDHGGEDDSDCTSSSSESSSSLGCQTSFPSVVSLDQGGGDGEQKPPAVQDAGPGMSI